MKTREFNRMIELIKRSEEDRNIVEHAGYLFLRLTDKQWWKLIDVYRELNVLKEDDNSYIIGMFGYRKEAYRK